jgi:beta-lactamase regulating signal transducer with metallopeptidase domain
MNALIETLSGPLWRGILLTLAHSLWQGAAIALILAGILSHVAGNRPQARYLASMISLAVLVISCLVTWSIFDLPAPRPVADELAVAVSPITSNAIPSNSSSASASPLWKADRPAQDTWQLAAALCNAAWITGMTAMLLRMAWLLTGVRRFARRPPITDPRILQIVERLRKQLHIVRRIAVVEATAIGPAVLGALRPVLLLPAAIIAELSAECLEAIIAHELAHIRRHDYLVNLVQMLIEAVLFFNPAVWWISRQIRREREACCDALAVRATGQPLTYADALAAWIERGTAPALAVSFSNGRSSGGVLDRVQRLLIADYRPELRGSWLALAVGSTVSALVVIALWSGTRAGVVFAAEILSPAERIEQLVQERDALRPVALPGAKATLAGTVRTVDGGSLPKELLASYLVYMEGSSSCGGTRISTPKFEKQLPWGKTWLSVVAPGYAPAVLGPLSTKPSETLDDLEIVFQCGFTTRLQLVDEQGSPVADADVSAIPGGLDCGFPIHWKADDAGMVTAEHVADLDYKLTITAPRFQTFRSGILRFKPDETTRLTLSPAASTDGTVVSEAGDPIAGATIRRSAWNDGKTTDLSGTFGPILTSTDAQGHFALDNLDDGTRYSLVVDAPAGGRRVFSNVRAGQPGLRWVIGPPWSITGQILAGPTTSAEDLKAVSYSQSVTLRQSSSSSYEFYVAEGSAAVEHKNNTLQFRIENVVQVPELTDGNLYRVGVRVAKQNFQFVLDRSTTELTVDLASRPSAARHVVLRFVGAEPGLSPSGTVFVSGDVSAREPTGTPGALVVPIAEGTAQFDVNAPGYVHVNAKNIVGYWFRDSTLDVPAGTNAFEHDVPVTAAGAIRGRVFNVDGTPATDIGNVNYRLLAGSLPGSEISMIIGGAQSGSSPEFFVSPLPLGGSYVLSASRGFETTISGPIRLDAATPNPSVDLQFSRVWNATGQVLGPDEKPLADVAVTLELRSPQQDTHYEPSHVTGRDGRFEFRGLSTGVGPYWARVRPVRDFQPVDVLLPDDRESLIILLKAGHVIEGRLINAGTGKAIEGVELFARPRIASPAFPWRYEPEQPITDADGKFRFSTLPDGIYVLHVQGSDSSSATEAYQTFHTTSGFGEPIELRVLRSPQN